MYQWHGRCISSNIRMKHISILRWLTIRKELIDNGCREYSSGLEVFKIRKLAQHYLNGLRISAFLIRHGFDRMKVKRFVSMYEDLVYPFLYHN